MDIDNFKKMRSFVPMRYSSDLEDHMKGLFKSIKSGSTSHSDMHKMIDK